MARPPLPALVSRSTILILSGFLMGMGLSQSLSSGTRLPVFAAAIVGALAYGTLERVTQERQAQVERQQRRASQQTLERRVERHVAPADEPCDDSLTAARRKRDLTLFGIMGTVR